MKERTLKRVIGTVFFGAVPGAMAAHSVSGMRYAGSIQKPLNCSSTTVISCRCFTQYVP